MRAIAFFENSQLSESTMYAERWVDLLIDRCFQSQKLDRFALVSGVPSLPPENTTVNFGTIEVPDHRDLIRVLFELPDLPGDDILLMFAGSHIKVLADKDPAEYTELDQIYINVVSGCFGAVKHSFLADDPVDTEFVSFLSVPNVEESRQFAMTALIRNAKVEQAQQTFVASPALINRALEEGMPLPPGLPVEALEEARKIREGLVPFNVIADEPKQARGETPAMVIYDESPFIPDEAELKDTPVEQEARGLDVPVIRADEASFNAGPEHDVDLDTPEMPQ